MDMKFVSSHRQACDADGASSSPGLNVRHVVSLPLGISARRPAHPGKMLQSHFLAPSGMTQGELARCLGISRRRLNELLNERRGITADTALRLAAYFSTDAFLWMDWQARYALYHAWKGLRSTSFFIN
jgi:addiction module HigA family antidote